MAAESPFSNASAFLASDERWYVRLYFRETAGKKRGYITHGPYDRYVDLSADMRGRYGIREIDRDLAEAKKAQLLQPEQGPAPPVDCIPGAAALGVELVLEKVEDPVKASSMLWFPARREAEGWLLRFGDPEAPDGQLFVIGDPREAFPKNAQEEQLLSRLLALHTALDNYDDRLLLRAQLSGHRLAACPNCLTTYSPRLAFSVRCPTCNSRRRLEGHDEREERHALRSRCIDLQDEVDALRDEPHRPSIVRGRIRCRGVLGLAPQSERTTSKS